MITLPPWIVALMCALAGSLIMFFRRVANGRRPQRSRWREKRSMLTRVDAALGPYFWGTVALALAGVLVLFIVTQVTGEHEPFR
jgi:hypothetical protein